MAIYSGFSNEKLWFSIAMLVYQRVTITSLRVSIGVPHFFRQPQVWWFVAWEAVGKRTNCVSNLATGDSPKSPWKVGKADVFTLVYKPRNIIHITNVFTN